jgi:hypothetical protein
MHLIIASVMCTRGKIVKYFKEIFMRPVLLVLILVMLSVTGCSALDKIIRPKPFNLGKTPEGSPIFQKGWDEGCESGLHVYGNSFYRGAYSYKQDINLINNQEYYRAWKDAYTYCRWYVWNYRTIGGY